MKSFDVLVVGASVAGCRTAELVAKEGYRVLVVEEHEKIGIPIKCTGLVSWRLKEILPDIPSEILLNTLEEATFYAPDGNSFTLKSKKPVYVIDRKKFDEHLSDRATQAGANFMLGTKFLNLDINKGFVKTINGEFKTEILIGADGANSYVARVLGLEQPKTKLIGLQATVKGNFENCAELWFGNSLAPNFFGWVVPEEKSLARIGLATCSQPLYYFKKFLKKRLKAFVKPNVVGLIRIGLMKNTVSDRVMLVGDAACMVKPFSGGGVIYSLIGAKISANACVKALEKREFSQSFLKNVYEKEWKKILAKPIRKGLFYRKLLSSLSDNQLNFAFTLIRRFGIKFLENFDMDFLSGLKLKS